MKLSTLLFFMFLMAMTAVAQNKTLGVGVVTPNPNAALHVEAPTANQGFIMPRLTTVQRTATSFVSALAATDNGLLVYDTDLKNIYIWTGTAWVSSAKPTFPFGESVENTLPNSSLFSLVNTGTTAGFFGVAAFENTNPNTSFSALYAKTNNSINGVADFVVDNPLNNNDGIGVITNGIGTAGRFNVNNAANATAAVAGSTNGTGVGVYGSTTGTGAAIQGYTASAFAAVIATQEGNGNGVHATTTGTGAAVQGTNNGAGNGFAGYFSNTNAGNTYPAIQVWTLGTGPGLRVLQGGGSNGGGVDVQLHDPANGSVGVSVLQRGTATASNFVINNVANTNAAIIAQTDGTGSAIYTNHTGASGNIAIFQSSSANVARIDKTGKGFFNGGTQTGGADVAELFDVIGDRNSYEPGDVLVISERKDRTVEKSNEQSSTRVVGVYATKPGVLLTEKGLDENINHLVPMGVIGVIPTKVCTENGVIRRGDLLVTSSKPGYAMKAIPVSVNGVLIYPTGAILGKALENLDKETGLINVFVNVK